MTHSEEIRRKYLGAGPHTLYTALIWLVGGVVGDISNPSNGIMVLIIGATFTFPMGELFRKLFKADHPISKENKLEKLFMLSAFSIPLCYPIIYWACKTDINYFFPAFSILIGAHYLVFVYGYGMKSFGIMALILVGQGILSSIYFPHQFGLAAYITAATLCIFGILNIIQVKQEIYV